MDGIIVWMEIMTERRDIFEYEDELKQGFYLVGLVDILGQKEKLAEVDKISVDNPEEFTKQLIEVWRPIQRLRAVFHETYTSFLDHRKQDALKESLTGPEKDIYEYFQSPPEIKFQGFSDTVVFYVDLSNDNKCLPITAVLLSLIACSAAISTLMAMGHSLRGGIDVGRAAKLYKNEIYGPPLVCAHHLESKKAKWPRILIGAGLIGYLRAALNTNDSDFSALEPGQEKLVANYLSFGSQLKREHPDAFPKYVNLIRNDAELCRRLIARDVDQDFMLDYLGEFISTLLSKLPKHDSGKLFQMASSFAASERERFHKLGDDKLYPRYIKLCDYIESRSSFWKT